MILFKDSGEQGRMRKPLTRFIGDPSEQYGIILGSQLIPYGMDRLKKADYIEQKQLLAMSGSK
uniref:Transposase n=1 Tax=Heterorhabditis bacteriophora TaxID=37862 RepID=A0A1I7WWF8_HETBA